MFSKSKINEPGAEGRRRRRRASRPGRALGDRLPQRAALGAQAQAARVGPVRRTCTSRATSRPPATSQIEGQIEGDIRAHLLTVGEGATVKGELIADDVVINGRIVGRVRGLKVRLTSTARVEGDIIHKTIAIESGAHFEGSVQRQDDPLNTDRGAEGPAEADAGREPGLTGRRLVATSKSASGAPRPRVPRFDSDFCTPRGAARDPRSPPILGSSMGFIDGSVVAIAIPRSARAWAPLWPRRSGSTTPTWWRCRRWS